MFLLLGFLVEETPCEHGENMQTPHRKAREIALIIKTFVRFLMAHTTHWNTHVHIWRRHRTHTHTHTHTRR